jgi:hypothetical protein
MNHLKLYQITSKIQCGIERSMLPYSKYLAYNRLQLYEDPLLSEAPSEKISEAEQNLKERFEDEVRRDLESMSFDELEMHFKDLNRLLKERERAIIGYHTHYLLSESEERKDILLQLYQEFYKNNCLQITLIGGSTYLKIPEPETFKEAREIGNFPLCEVLPDGKVMLDLLHNNKFYEWLKG